MKVENGRKGSIGFDFILKHCACSLLPGKLKTFSGDGLSFKFGTHSVSHTHTTTHTRTYTYPHTHPPFDFFLTTSNINLNNIYHQQQHLGPAPNSIDLNMISNQCNALPLTSCKIWYRCSRAHSKKSQKKVECLQWTKITFQSDKLSFNRHK